MPSSIVDGVEVHPSARDDLSALDALSFRQWSIECYDDCMTTKLQQEIACYEANKAQLVDEHPDEYVLIKGDDMVGYPVHAS